MSQSAPDEMMGVIMPPSHPNYSSTALEAAYEALDPHTRSVLDIERARLTLETGVAAFALTEALNLNGRTAADLKQALETRLSSMSPEYQSYVNRLLGHAAVAIGMPALTEIRSKNVDEKDTVTEKPIVDIEDTVIKDETSEVLTEEPQETLHLITVEETSEDTEQDSTTGAGDVQKSTLTNEEIAKALGIRLHSKVSTVAKGFIEKIFEDNIREIDKLSPQEIGLLGWGLIKTFETMHIPRVPADGKVKHIERMKQVFGFEGPMMSQQEIARATGVRGPVISLSLKRVSEYLRGEVGDKIQETLQLARSAADNLVGVTEPAVEVADATEAQQAFAVVENLTTDETSAEEVTPKVEGPLLYDYYRGIPASIKNFLSDCYLPKELEDIGDLNPMQATWLASQIVGMHKAALIRSGKNESVVNKKTKILERMTGIYEQAEDPQLIGQRMIISGQSVQDNYYSALKTIEQKISRNELQELLKKAASMTAAQLAPLFRIK